MYKWNGESWRKYLVVDLKKIRVKRSSDKFARSSEEKPIEQSFKPEIKGTFYVFQ